MALKAAELEVLFTVNLDQVAKAEKDVKASAERIEKKPVKIGADPKGALAGMAQVEAEAKKIVSAKTLATVDANIDRAEKQFMRVKERLDYLRSVETELDVKADISRAHAQLDRVTRSMEGLRNARAVMTVDADTSAAEDAFEGAAGAAGDAGTDAGAEFGDNVVAALLSIPIAGAVIGVGVAAGKALLDGVEQGLSVEMRADRLAALAGLSEEDAARIGRGAGEAYANVFGESIEQNMDVARLGVQFDLIDPDATARSAQRTVQSLTGIADALGEDVEPIARAVAQMLRTDVVKSADAAFDVLAAGQREGVNIGGDLLDTFTEYSTQFRKLGLDGPQALGLLQQALRNGARDSDIAADALKEFGIRAVDPAYKEAFDDLGFSWDDLSGRISRGGPEAAAALEETLDQLRGIEDPARRNAAALELFGSQGEDMADALSAMDLSSAVEELGTVAGAAQAMFDTLSDNDGTRVERAQRSIETAVSGIQGALAQVFSDPLSDFADWVSQNRGPLLQFFTDLALGAVDFAETATDAFGDFVAGPLATIVEGIKHVLKATAPWSDLSDLENFIDGMKGMDEVTDTLGAGYDDLRDKIRGAMDPQIALAEVSDAALRTADAVDSIGDSADGVAPKLEAQASAALAALEAELEAAVAAGESQADLQGRYDTATAAIGAQLEAMGLEKAKVDELIAAYGLVPSEVPTKVTVDTTEAKRILQETFDMIAALGGTSTSATPSKRAPYAFDPLSFQANGSVLMPMAHGGKLSPMAPIAQTVAPNTWRVVGDRMDVPEIYAPLDGSSRSLAILLEGLRSFGVLPMADGGVVGSSASMASGGGFNWNGDLVVEGADTSSPVDLGRLIRREVEAFLRERFGNRGGL